jgi:hypothetical protein
MGWVLVVGRCLPARKVKGRAVAELIASRGTAAVEGSRAQSNSIRDSPTSIGAVDVS